MSTISHIPSGPAGTLASAVRRIALLSAIGVLAGLSGCLVAPRDHGPYRYENGDRIDRDGRHEAHWCDDHRGDEHCRR